MSQDARLQMALAHDPGFLDRVQFSLCRVALQVCAEAVETVGHATRRLYAQAVLGNPAAAAVAAAVALVSQVNLTAPVTEIHPDKTVTSGASDADIDSQVATLWNAFAGV